MATSKAMKEWEKKYAAQIKGLAEANKVDLGVASSMLQANLTSGGQYKGGGTISSVQAASELAAAQKAGRAAASTSAKRAAASLGATIPTATVPTADAYYSDQLTALADAQRKAEEQAAKLRTQQAISSVEGYIPQIQQQTAKQMQEAYIAAQRAKMQAPQTLSALGYTGGATESSLLGLDTDYMNRRQALAEAEAQSLDQIRQNVADIRASGNVDLANLAAQYYEQAMANQREAMAQQTAQSQWEQELAMRQAEQAEATRQWEAELALAKAKQSQSMQKGEKDYSSIMQNAIKNINSLYVSQDPITGQSIISNKSPIKSYILSLMLPDLETTQLLNYYAIPMGDVETTYVGGR